MLKQSKVYIKEFIHDLFGDKEDRAIEQNIKSLSDVFTYEVYDEETDLYINQQNIGYIVELNTICSADSSIVKSISNLFAEAFPEKCVVQILNWASPSISHILEAYKYSRKDADEVYKQLVNKRDNYLQKANWANLFNYPSLIKNHRLLISVAMPLTEVRAAEELIKIREQLLSLLKVIGAEGSIMSPKHLINFINEILIPKTMGGNKEKDWDRNNPISKQIITSNSDYEITENGIEIEFEGEKFELRSYSATGFPNYWAQWQSNDLIGDFMSDYSRFSCPYLTVLTLNYTKQSEVESYAKFKLLRAIQANNAGLGRFTPSVGQIEQDWRAVNNGIANGNKLIRANYQVILLSKKAEIEYNERTLLSLYKIKEWNLIKEKLVSLPMLMLAMPLGGDHLLLEDLEKRNTFKYIQTSTAANIAPLQGEWKGSRNPLLQFIGRRGQIFHVDPFENTGGNFNCAVFAKSGAG